MIFKKTTFWLWASMLAAVAVSCQKLNYAEDHPPANSNDTCTQNVSYQSRIKAILNTNCAFSGCHDGANTDPNLTQYSTASAAASKIRERACIKKDMPPGGPMSDCDIAKLRYWCENGTPQ